MVLVGRVDTVLFERVEGVSLMIRSGELHVRSKRDGILQIHVATCKFLVHRSETLSLLSSIVHLSRVSQWSIDVS